MRLRTAAVTSLMAVAAVGALTPATAAPKPITKTYTASATPDPTASGVQGTCNPVTPSARHTTPFKVPAAGTLSITIKMDLDWALGLRTKSGSTLAASDGPGPTDAEAIQMKFKKATEVLIDACNFAGGPTAQVTYTFTYK